MSRNPVVLEVYPTVMIAELVQDRLSAEGIEAFVADEAMGRIYPGTTVGGIRVLVAEDDLQRARDVLANLSHPLGTSANELSEEDLQVLTSEAEAAPPVEEPTDDPVAERRLRRVLLGLLVLGLLGALGWLLLSRRLL